MQEETKRAVMLELSYWDIETINSAVSQKFSNFCDGIPKEERNRDFIRSVSDDYKRLLFKVRGAREEFRQGGKK